MSTNELPPAYFRQWGVRIYGCQICQTVCPWNKKAPRSLNPSPGTLVPLEKILAAPAGEVKNYLEKTAMNQKWIKERHIIRNALVAAGNHPERQGLRRLIESHCSSPDKDIRIAAEWALSQTNPAGE